MRPTITALALIASAHTPAAQATTPVPPDMTVHATGADVQAQREQLRAAPVHGQVLLLDAPAEWGPGFGRCTVDASVIRSFKGAAVLPAGTVFRLSLPCSSFLGQHVWQDRDPVHVGRVFWGELTQGRILEAYLDHFGPRLGYRLAGFPTEGSTAPEERFVFLPADTLQPRLTIPPPGEPLGALHFWTSGRVLEQALQRARHASPPVGPECCFPALSLDVESFGFENRGQEQPPAFPTRQVAQTVTHPDRPGREYRMLYDPDTWRTRVDELDVAGQPTGLVDYGDAMAGIMVEADTRARSATKLADLGGGRGHGWLGIGVLGLSPLLHSWQLQQPRPKTIAQTPCTDYAIVQERWHPHEFMDEGHICITADGIALESSSAFSLVRPYTTIKVDYPAHAAASDFQVPQGWPVTSPR